jgi:hypothetical protein
VVRRDAVTRALIAIVALLVALPLAAQFNQPARRIVRFAAAPATCAEGDKYYDLSTHHEYTCTAANTWSQTDGGGGGGSGTVTSVGLLGTANQITVTGASPITTSGSWTLSLPATTIATTAFQSGATAANHINVSATSIMFAPIATGNQNQLLYTDTVGPAWSDGNTGNSLVHNIQALSAQRTVTWPNANTSIPVIPQTITVTGPTAAWTWTAPDANFTLARTDAANTFTGHQTIEGVTSTGATGSGRFVFDTSPTITTPTISGALGGNLDLGTSADAIEIANAGTTGTTVNHWAKLTGAPSTAVISATTDTDGAVGLVVAGAGTTGSAVLARNGMGSCVFDGATTAGDYVQLSSTVAGDCHDAGSTRPTSGQILGRVTTTNGAGGTFAMTISGLGIAGVPASSGANTALSNLAAVAINQPLTTGAGTVAALTTTPAAQTASTTAGVGLTLTADNAVAGSTNAGAAAGGNVTVTAGSAAQKTSGNANGGNIILTPGAGIGTGTAGFVQLPNGTAAAPGQQWVGSFQNDGWWYDATNHIIVRSVNGVNLIALTGGPVLRLNSSGVFGWPSTTDADTGSDTGISRGAAGVVDIGTGAAANTAGFYNYGGTSRVAADLTNSTATMSNMTGITSTLASGRKYIGRLTLKCVNSSATEGIQFDFNGGTATMTNFFAGAGILASGGTDVIGTNISTSLAGAITFTTFTGESLVVIEISMVVNAGGTFIPRFAENSHTSGTATVRLGSFQWLEDTP